MRCDARERYGRRLTTRWSPRLRFRERFTFAAVGSRHAAMVHAPRALDARALSAELARAA